MRIMFDERTFREYGVDSHLYHQTHLYHARGRVGHGKQLEEKRGVCLSMGCVSSLLYSSCGFGFAALGAKKI
jgi:hypothetical protein